MKPWKIIVLMITMTFLWSCSDDDGEYANFHYVVAPIDSISLVDSAMFGERIPITTYTMMKEDCQNFQMYDYQVVGNERTVATWLVQWDDVACGEDVLIEPSFFFEPLRRGTYRFRFWAGQNADTEEDIFITKDIVIH